MKFVTTTESVCEKQALIEAEDARRSQGVERITINNDIVIHLVELLTRVWT